MLLRFSDQHLLIDQKPWSATAYYMAKQPKTAKHQEPNHEREDILTPPRNNQYLFILLGVLVALPLIVFCISFIFDRNVTQFLLQYPKEGHVELVRRLLDNAYQSQTINFLAVFFVVALGLFTLWYMRYSLRKQQEVLTKLHASEQERNRQIEQLDDLVVYTKDLYNHAPIGYHSIDANGLIIEMNATELEWLGYQANEVIGKMNFASLLPRENRSHFDETMRALIHDGEINGEESILINKRGDAIPVLHSAKAVYDNDHQFLYSRSTVYNFTERKKLESELNKAWKEAEKSSLLKEQFMANMSHEIRTPLNAILGFSELLGHTPVNKDQQDFIQNIRMSSENLLSIVNDILDFSKIEAGALKLEEIPFSLAEVVQAVQQLFQFRSGDQLLFTVRIDPGLPDHLKGDPTRLTQVLINLLGNAFKFTKQGEVTLDISEAGRDQQVQKILFTISDTGIGIPADQIDRIFERFTQATPETTRTFGGTGLGLTISKQLVELQGGTIQLKSLENTGTTFLVTIPYKVVADQAPKKIVKKDAPARDKFPQREVLVVEDNVLNARILNILLSRWGLQCTLAENGKEALEILRKKPFDLILMDIQMPEMDGHMTTQKIRKELHLNTKIIATTAHAFAGEREKCIRNGMDEYISKPIREEELLRLIRRYIPSGENASVDGSSPNPETVHQDHTGFDRTYVEELAQHNPETLREMATIFLEQVQTDIERVDKALSRSDAPAVSRIAHSLQSTASYMGFAATLGADLKQMEKEAAKPDPDFDYLHQLHQRIQEDAISSSIFIRSEYLDAKA
ncbi:MAG TPA: ATP-binding protein [Saprospiraceae bacterium]|nr:ATP-binding protein [Saprospiraceae bacterium]